MANKIIPIRFIIIINSIILLLLNSAIIFADLPKNTYTNFDSIALQLALAQNKMQSPLSLEQIQSYLGTGDQETISNITYSWIYKNRALLVTTEGNNISNKILSGNNDGSVISKKMEEIFANLKSATSIWSIREIQKKLGPGYSINNKIYNYSWHYGGGTLIITTDTDNKIKSAKINYRGTQEQIEMRLGPNHPEWDIKTDSLGQAYRAWQRSFES